MDLFGSEVGLRLLLYPLGSNVVVRTACCSVGIVLPVYSTFKAIERRDQREQQKWLVYWAAYGSFSLVEAFTDKLLSWFPLYYHAKLAFLIWLQLPSTDGAMQFYINHLRPFFVQHQAKVDQVVGLAYSQMAKIISSHQAEIQFTRAMVGRVMGSAEQMLRGVTNPDQPRGQSTMDGQSINEPRGLSTIEGQSRTISDTESHHDD